MGVTSSTSRSTPYSGAPSSSSSVGGRGQRQPPVRGLARSRGRRAAASRRRVDAEVLERERDAARRRRSRRSRRPRGSAPRSGGDAVDAALGVGEPPERLLRALRARARGGRPRRSARGSAAQSRCGCSAARRTTSIRRGADPVPARCAVADDLDAEAGQPVADGRLSAPASSSAPSSMSPATPADAVDVEEAGHARAGRAAMRAAIVPAPNPSSMLTTATPARAGGEHRQQRDHAAERRAVARAGRHADDGRGDEPADDRRERRVLAGDDDHAVRRAQVLQRRREPVQPRHARVLVDDRPRSRAARAHLRLARRRRRPTCRRRRSSPAPGPPARRARPTPAAPARPPRRPSTAASAAARAASSARVTITLPGPPLDEPGDDRGDLVRRLALGEHGLRRALPSPRAVSTRAKPRSRMGRSSAMRGV